VVTSLSCQQILDCRNPRRRPVNTGSELLIFVPRAGRLGMDSVPVRGERGSGSSPGCAYGA
jgi:hypothetical protein